MVSVELRWGVLGTGAIARAFARGIAESATGRLVAVGSRSKESAEAFARDFGPARAYRGRDALLADPEVDAVYVATPHHTHFADTVACARAGKAILCEKPFVLTGDEAGSALAEVQRAGVAFMEAFMYRCTPGIAFVRELLASGAIGMPMQLNAEFGFASRRDWDNFRTDAALGGGGLMDVGTYCVSLSRLVFEGEATTAHYAIGMTEGGYDGAGAGLLTYEGGRSAHFGCGIHLAMRNDASIYGADGWIQLNDPWKWGEAATVEWQSCGGNVEERGFGLTGAQLYAREADAFACAVAGSGEAPEWTHADTLAQARTLDRLKASAGMKFSSP